MKFCTNCGTQLPDEAYVCNQCGTALGQAPVQQSYAPPQQSYAPPQQSYAPPQGYASPQQSYAPPQGYAPQQGYAYAPASQISGLAMAAKILMIISTVIMGIYIIPLAWCLPMTISYCKKLKTGQPVGIGFKICTLLFVNTISGILMLCDNKN